MKVLREGKSWILEHDCTGYGNGNKGCGALLGIERIDLRYFAGGGYIERDPAVVFRCPCCGQTTDLGLNDWPRQASDLVKWTEAWRDGREQTEAN